MEPQKPSVFFEHREFFYTLKSKTETQIEIEMYHTLYVLVKDKDGRWSNHANNRNSMSKGLLAAVIEVLKP